VDCILSVLDAGAWAKAPEQTSAADIATPKKRLVIVTSIVISL
jgi:hypothetical protein